MKSLLKRLTAGLLSGVLLVGVLPIGVLAEELVDDPTGDTVVEDTIVTGEYGGYVEMYDSYLSLKVSTQNGGFLVDTVAGDTMEKDDDNKFLLYPDENYDTSFTSFRVTRGEKVSDYIFGRSYPDANSSTVVTTVSDVNKTITSVWSVDNITFTQNLTLLEMDNIRHGMVYITYGVENTGDTAATVKTRILMDTALGYQDYAVYELTNLLEDQVAGGSYTTVEREGIYPGTSYDNAFFAYDSATNPTITAYTINAIMGDETVTPTQVAFGHWNNLAATVYDFVPNTDLTFTNPYNLQYLTADSAYALYFDVGTLEATTGTGIIGTYYGVQSNVSVSAEDSVAINFSSLPEAMVVNEAGDAYESQIEGGISGDFSISITVENITEETLNRAVVAVYPKTGITPYNPDGVLQYNATYADPYYVEIADFKAGETVPITFSFNAEIGSPSDYRDIEFQVYDVDGVGNNANNTGYNLLIDKELGERTAYVLCPSVVGEVLSFYTTTPEAIYTSGTRHLYLSGENFNLLSDTASYSVKLVPLNGSTSITLDPKYVLLDTETNSMDLILEDYMLPGMWQVVFDWADPAKNDTTTSALCFTVDDSPNLVSRTYGIVAIQKGYADNTYLLKTYETEADYDAAFYGDYEEQQTVLMTYRGDFIPEYDENDELIKVEAVAVGDASIVISDCLDVDNGSVTITVDDPDGGDQVINTAIDGSVYTTGSRTRVWSGVCAITPFADGDESALLVYNYAGEVQDNIENSVANTNGITLVWPGAASGLQTLAGMMFELRYGQFGLMCTDKSVGTVDLNANPTRRILCFGAELSPDFLVPNNFDWGSQETSSLEKAQLALASSNYTADQLMDVQDRYASDQAAWEAAAGGSASFYVHDIIFGGEFIGFNTQIDVELPSYADGLPSIQGSLALKVMNDEWAFGVEGSADMSLFTAEATLKIESYNGIPVPDEIYLFVGGFNPGVNVIPPAVFWIRGAGGGVSNIYDTMFKPSVIPPVTLTVSGEFSLFNVLATRANISMSMRGVAGNLEDLSVAEVTLIDYLGVSAYWYPEIKLGAGIEISILDLIKGTGSLVLEEDQTGMTIEERYYWEGFASASISIPDKYPVVGGASLGTVSLGVNAEKVWGGFNVLKTDASVTYYWGGEVDFALGKYDATETTLGTYIANAVPVYTDEESGQTLYMSLNNITHMDLAPEVTGSSTDKLTHTVAMGAYEVGDSLLYIQYPAASQSYAQTMAQSIVVTGETSGNYALNWLDNSYTADAPENANANAMMRWDEDDQRAYVTISFTEEAVFNQKVTITTPVASDVTAYEVTRLAGLESIIVDANKATITGDLSELGKLTIYAISSDGDACVVYRNESVDGVTSPWASNTTGSVQVDLSHPLTLASGTYTYKAVGTALDESSNPSVEQEAVSYVNPKAPTNLTSATAELGGDYSIDLSVTAGGDYDGYVVAIYDAEGNEVFQGTDFAGAVTSGDTTLLTVGGRYETTAYEKDGAYYSADEAFDVDGNLMEGYTETTLYNGVEAGQTYTAAVYGYVTDDSTGVQIPTATAKPTVLMVAPVETVLELTIDDSVKYATVTTSEGEYQIDTVTTSDVTVNLSEALLDATYTLNGEDGGSVTGTTIALTDLADGTYTLAVRGENATKDSVYEQYLFHVDTTAPTLLLSGPINGSFFDSTVTVAGITEINDAIITITLDGVLQSAVTVDENGNFTKNLMMNTGLAQQTITITSSDGLGNTSEPIVLTLTNALLTGETYMALYLDGVDITDTAVDADAYGQLSVMIVTADGTEIALGQTMTDNLEWSLVLLEGDAILSPNGYLTNPNGTHATVSVSMDDTLNLLAVVGGVEEVDYEAEDTGSSGNYFFSSSSSSKTVAIKTTGSGAVVADDYYADQGDTVTLTITPVTGRRAATLTVVDADGNAITVTENNGYYSFVMPEGKVSVTVSFITGYDVDGQFTDVTLLDWFYGAVGYAYDMGMMNGTSETTFGPYDIASRGMIATILHRLEGAPEVDSQDRFPDVGEDIYYTQAIAWAQSVGVVTGYDNGNFGPNDPVTREQLVLILYRYMGSPAIEEMSGDFVDVDTVSDYALEAVTWAVNQGILTGKDGNRLDPQATTTRAELATIMQRLFSPAQ